MIQNGGQFPSRKPDVQRHHDCASLNNAKISLQQFVRVEAQIGNAISALNAESPQRRRETPAAVSKLAYEKRLS